MASPDTITLKSSDITRHDVQLPSHDPRLLFASVHLADVGVERACISAYGPVFFAFSEQVDPESLRRFFSANIQLIFTLLHILSLTSHHV